MQREWLLGTSVKWAETILSVHIPKHLIDTEHSRCAMDKGKTLQQTQRPLSVTELTKLLYGIVPKLEAYSILVVYNYISPIARLMLGSYVVSFNGSQREMIEISGLPL